MGLLNIKLSHFYLVFKRTCYFFLVLGKFFPMVFLLSIKSGCLSKAFGNVNRQNLQIIGITVKTVKNTKVIVYFTDINLVTGIIGLS
jgi:hypothetical protein